MPSIRFKPARLTGCAAAALAVAAAINHLAAKRAERAHPPRGAFLEVEGVRLHYLEAGAGPVILMIHGNGVSADDFVTSGLFSALAARHRVIAIDRPGYGHSTRPGGRRWDAAAQADLLLKGAMQIGAQEALVVGHSWGTLVALEAALSRPDFVRGLALISGYYIPSFRLDSLLAAGPGLPVLGSGFRYTLAPMFGRLMAPVLLKQLFSPAPVPERFQSDYSVGMAVRPGQIQAEASDGAAMVRTAALLNGRAGELQLPVVLLGGRKDKLVSFHEQTEAFAERLADAEVLAFDDAGHMVHYVATDAIAAAIQRLSARVPPRVSAQNGWSAQAR